METENKVKACIKHWWGSNKNMVKIAVKVGAITFCIGFIRGVICECRHNASVLNRLLDKENDAKEEWIEEIADYIRQYGWMQLHCSDGEPLAVCKDRKE